MDNGGLTFPVLEINLKNHRLLGYVIQTPGSTWSLDPTLRTIGLDSDKEHGAFFKYSISKYCPIKFRVDEYALAQSQCGVAM